MSESDALLERIQRTAPARERPPAPSRLRIALAVTGLLLYGAVVLAATLSPTPLDAGYGSAIEKMLGVLHRNGVPEWFGYSKLEFSANIVMFVPLGFLLALALPRKVVWLTIVLIPALSGSIELVQGAMLSERFASMYDVAANTIGGYFGAVCAVFLRAVVDARDQKVIARALWERRARS